MRKPNPDIPDIPERLDGLLAELCDGSPNAEEVAELEHLAGASAAARRYVVGYLQLHGELLWSIGRIGEPAAVARHPREGAVLASSGFWRRVRSLSAAFLVSTCGIIIAGLLYAWYSQPSEPRGTPVAVLAESLDAMWDNEPRDKVFLKGSFARLAQGFARIETSSGASVLLEGPAEVRFSGGNSLDLRSGRLTARVPDEAAGFIVRAPCAFIVDLGTEFGVTVSDPDSCEVCVFAGKVEVKGDGSSRSEVAHGLSAGEIVEVLRRGDSLQFKEKIHCDSRFVRRLPPPPAFSLREAVASHPALVHHYTFEGLNPLGRRQDRRGSLHLLETVLQGGIGTGSLTYPVVGALPSTDAVAIRRSQSNSDTQGKALQSERDFVPPERMTLELLLRFDGFPAPGAGSIAAAVATRADASDCGFFLGVVEDGQLAHLFDADANWVETGFIPRTGEWYYVVSTFEPAGGNQTKINTFVASLSDEHPELVHVVKGHVVEGTPAVGRLGIGKGFDETRAHAYPWSGALDEIAVYNEVLEEPRLKEHLSLLSGTE